MTLIAGRSSAAWTAEFPLLADILACRPVFWPNPSRRSFAEVEKRLPVGREEAEEALARLARFAPFIAVKFPETAGAGGLIESPLVETSKLKAALESLWKKRIPGRMLVKMDAALPISGSIKARGGIYEVLAVAEDLAFRHSMLAPGDNYSMLAEPRFRKFFSGFKLAVGSTGNLGLSVGIMGAALGFSVTVHMSADAQVWKKDLLRANGVIVREYADDYSFAVAQGRKEAEADPACHFVDDEASRHLFLGYAVAGLRLGAQLAGLNGRPEAGRPLYVHLPCGVGGGPGGVAFGLKLAFGDAVRCFFAEPVNAPAMLLGLYTGLHEKASSTAFGIPLQTAADGLAVGAPSALVCEMMEPLLDGLYTLEDRDLFTYLALAADCEGLKLEPSALAGVPGLLHTLEHDLLPGDPEKAVHIVWATGGNLVPRAQWEGYVQKGRMSAA